MIKEFGKWMKDWRSISLIVLAIIVIIAMIKGCNYYEDLKRRGGHTTIIKTDTVFTVKDKVVKDTFRVVMPNPQVILIDTTSDKYLSEQYIFLRDSIETDISRKNEIKFNDMKNKFLAEKHYDNTFELKDNLGKIRLEQTIQENEIKKIQIYPEITQREITKTITITQIEIQKPRRKVYVGGEVATSIPNLSVQAIDIGGLYKDKTEKIFKLSYGRNFALKENQVTVGAYLPLKLK